MSGPEHYQQAEELLNHLEGKDRETYPGQESIIAEAQERYSKPHVIEKKKSAQAASNASS